MFKTFSQIKGQTKTKTTQFERIDRESSAHSHKTLEYNIHTHTPKSSDQKAVFIDYGVLIGCLSRRRSLKFVLESFITVRPVFGTFGFSRSCNVEKARFRYFGFFKVLQC